MTSPGADPHNTPTAGRPGAIVLTPSEIATTGHGGSIYSRGVLRLLTASGLLSDIDVINLRGHGGGHARRAERLLNLLRSFVSNVPERVLSSVTAAGRRAAERAASDHHRVAIFDHLGSLCLRDVFNHCRARAFVCHALEHNMLIERIAHDPVLPAAVKPLLRHDAARLETYQRAAGAELDAIWCISSAEAEWWREVAPEAAIVAVPPTFAGDLDQTARAALAPRQPLRLGFLGSLSWWPNAEAVDWLIAQVLPALEGRAELHLFGGDARGRDRDPGLVKAHGFVPDIEDVWRGMDIAVCPIHAGGGSNVKFAEAVFRGVPILATSYAGRGLPLIADDAVRYLDSAREWVEFLRSDAAEKLAASRPRDATRMTFADATYKPAVAAFLQALLSG